MQHLVKKHIFYIAAYNILIITHFHTLLATDCEEMAFLADIDKAVFGIYRIKWQFPIATMFVNFLQSVKFGHFLFNNIRF